MFFLPSKNKNILDLDIKPISAPRPESFTIDKFFLLNKYSNKKLKKDTWKKGNSPSELERFLKLGIKNDDSFDDSNGNSFSFSKQILSPISSWNKNDSNLGNENASVQVTNLKLNSEENLSNFSDNFQNKK